MNHLETAHPSEPRPEIRATQHNEETDMHPTQNFFDNPNGGNAGWGAGVGGLIGAALGSGNGLFGGGNRETATLDQVDSRFNSLQGQMSADALQAQLGRLQGEVGRTSADSTIALGAAIAGVKDAINCNQAQTNLALCGLGHSMQAGFASVNQTILMEAAKGRELTLSENLAQARAALATAHSDAQHTATQVLIQNLVKA